MKEQAGVFNKIAAVSGALGDIGRAVAEVFLRDGFRVALSDVKPAADAQAALIAFGADADNILYTQVDVSSEAEVQKWLSAIESKWGVPQFIIPNAGIVVSGMLTELPQGDVRKQIDVNFWGSYNLAVLAAKRMKAAGLPGRMVLIGSWAAERPNARISSYCISKAAVRMLCKSLALELAAHQILVNEIAPGIVSGGLSKKNQQKDPSLLQTHLDSIPNHTLITVEEIARQVLWLCDMENMNITGTTLLVDGGLSLTSKMTK
ncbi:MAG: hypothetical protein K0S09_3200 [Sphingobacteriaceae bacterium]|jgi:glucose 1-dehydrogenase|nr:hypothetical protein [Sphingobacteriaceae bacterium]